MKNETFLWAVVLVFVGLVALQSCALNVAQEDVQNVRRDVFRLRQRVDELEAGSRGRDWVRVE